MAQDKDTGFIDLFDVRRLGRKSRSGVDAPIQVGFLILLSLVGFGAWIQHFNTRLLYENQAEVSHTYRLLGQVNLVFSTAIDAETGARGYIATGLESYLQPYDQSAQVVESRLAELSLLAVEQESQRQLVVELGERMKAHFAYLHRIVSAGISGEKEAAIEAMRSGDGKMLMDSIRETIADIQENEKQRLDDREIQARSSYRTAVLTGLGVAISGAFMILVVYNLVRRFERLREQSTREIAEARELFEVALGSIGDAVIVTDAEGRLAYCNDGCRSTLQVQSEDIGRPLEELIASIADGTTSLHESIVKRAIAEGGIHRTAVETEIRLRDGSRIHIDATAARIPGQDGNSRGVVLVLRDVSDRRSRAVELSRSNERFRSLVLATSQTVWTTDSTGAVREDSPSWREYTGQTYEQWKGLGWLDVLHVDDRESTLHGWQAAIDEQRPFIAEYRLRKADGSYCWNMVRAVPVKDPDGTVREWVGMNHDIQARKRSEQDQRDANRRKDEFIALLAHELRNPLAPLRNGIEILKSGAADGSPRAIAMMDRQVQHMVRLIDDLLDVSRIGQGKLELRRERIDLCQVVREVVAASESSIEAKHQSVRVSLPRAPLWVDGDPVRLNQIVANLLNNAVKYSGDRADIWVTAEREGTRHLVSVRDSGQGIATDLRPRIWDLFLQGPGHIERSEGGLGIGLTLVKQLVELHDGTVEVHSEGVGTGSEFIVRLPVAAPPHDMQTGSTTPAATRAPVPALRVLVIDDNEDSADSTAMLLRLSGHTVRTETRGESGLVEFARFAPDIVLCDIRMPDLSGYEVARQIRLLPRGDATMLVALTGFGTQVDREESSLAGFDRHVVKPIDPDALTQLLREAAQRAAPRPDADGAA